MKRLICTAAFAAACLGPAAFAAPPESVGPANLTRASEGFIYFNRPGADLATHDAELKDCIDGSGNRAMVAAVPAVTSTPPPSYRFALDDRFQRVAAENCMVARGWRVVRLNVEMGRTLTHAKREDVVATLRGQVGAERPEGVVVRTWNNEALRGDTIQLTTPAGVMGGIASAWALDNEIPPAPPPASIPRTHIVPKPPPAPYPPLKPGELPATVPAGSTLVLFRMLGNGSHNGQGYTFTPADRDLGDQSRRVGPPRTFYSGLTRSLMSKGRSTPLETVGAVVVPAGRWRITALTSTMTYCLGSPAFEARSGAVLFLGTIDLSAADMRPQMDLEPARTFLASRPELAAAVEPAAWVNGTTAPCLGAFIYALEFPDYPFVEGYRWGSRAH